MAAPTEKKEIDISLQAYDPEYCPVATGLRNIGNTCFMNAIVQAMLGITSIFKTAYLQRESDSVANNPILQLFVKMFTDKSRINEYTQTLYREMIGKSLKRIDLTRMDIWSQEDSYEMFVFILEELCKCPDIEILFNHRTTTTRKCLKKGCGHTSTTRDTNQMFIVQPDIKVDQLPETKSDETSQDLNDFLKKYVSCVPDFTCKVCKDKGTKLTFTKVTMIPEVICVVFRKYFQKRATPFPMKLKFADVKEKKNYIYDLIAQVEHSGSQGGGHYYAICRRKDGWKRLDDESVSDGIPGPTENTYLVFYHYVGDEYV